MLRGTLPRRLCAPPTRGPPWDAPYGVPSPAHGTWRESQPRDWGDGHGVARRRHGHGEVRTAHVYALSGSRTPRRARSPSLAAPPPTHRSAFGVGDEVSWNLMNVRVPVGPGGSRRSPRSRRRRRRRAEGCWGLLLLPALRRRCRPPAPRRPPRMTDGFPPPSLTPHLGGGRRPRRRRRRRCCRAGECWGLLLLPALRRRAPPPPHPPPRRVNNGCPPQPHLAHDLAAPLLHTQPHTR